MALAFATYQAGAKSKLACAKAGKMTWPTFALYWQQFEMENWRPGDVFPPPRRAVLKKNREILFRTRGPAGTAPRTGMRNTMSRSLRCGSLK